MLFRSMEEKHKATLARNSRFERITLAKIIRQVVPEYVQLEFDSLRGSN